LFIAQTKRLQQELNEDGFRVIAVAYKELPPDQLNYSVADETNLILLGYIAFLDPPKDSAAKALAILDRDGVQVKILTGDNEIMQQISMICSMCFGIARLMRISNKKQGM
jgi:P-type Mg2+ transporter